MDPVSDTPHRPRRIRPGREWYLLASALLLGGVLLAVRAGFHEAGHTGDATTQLRRVLAPAVIGFVAGMSLIVVTAVARGRAKRLRLMEQQRQAADD